MNDILDEKLKAAMTKVEHLTAEAEVNLITARITKQDTSKKDRQQLKLNCLQQACITVYNSGGNDADKILAIAKRFYKFVGR